MGENTELCGPGREFPNKEFKPVANLPQCVTLEGSVWVRLTIVGEQHLDNLARMEITSAWNLNRTVITFETARAQMPVSASDGWCQFTLFYFMKWFGPYLGYGTEYFVENKIFITDPRK